MTRTKVRKSDRRFMTEQSGNEVPLSNLQVATELSMSTEIARNELPESEDS